MNVRSMRCAAVVLLAMGAMIPEARSQGRGVPQRPESKGPESSGAPKGDEAKPLPGRPPTAKGPDAKPSDVRPKCPATATLAMTSVPKGKFVADSWEPEFQLDASSPPAIADGKWTCTYVVAPGTELATPKLPLPPGQWSTKGPELLKDGKTDGVSELVGHGACFATVDTKVALKPQEGWLSKDAKLAETAGPSVKFKVAGVNKKNEFCCMYVAGSIWKFTVTGSVPNK